MPRSKRADERRKGVRSRCLSDQTMHPSGGSRSFASATGLPPPVFRTMPPPRVTDGGSVRHTTRHVRAGRCRQAGGHGRPPMISARWPDATRRGRARKGRVFEGRRRPRRVAATKPRRRSMGSEKIKGVRSEWHCLTFSVCSWRHAAVAAAAAAACRAWSTHRCSINNTIIFERRLFARGSYSRRVTFVDRGRGHWRGHQSD